MPITQGFDPEKHKQKAILFHQMHSPSEPLVLLNAWDATSARIFEQQGAKAIATTSAGIAASHGYSDGQLIPKKDLIKAVKCIINSVDIPVTVDLEAGYGKNLQEIRDTVYQILRMGAVGINIEDADPEHPECLFSIPEQMEKIKAIRALAKELDVPLFINARTDVFWLKLQATPEECLPETLTRLKAYKEAGADGVFVPGLTDPALISDIVKNIELPLNLLVGPWLKEKNTLKSLGVSRVTTGSAVVRDVTNHLKKIANKFIKEENYTCLDPTVSYNEFNNLFSLKSIAKEEPKPHIEDAVKNHGETQLGSGFFNNITASPQVNITQHGNVNNENLATDIDSASLPKNTLP